MPNFQEQLKKTLESQQKGIQDLIGQEMSLNFYAHFLVEHPEREAEVELLFEMIYKDTAQNLERLFMQIYYETQVEMSQEDIQHFRQTVQEFVHLQVSQTRQKLWDRVNWLEKRV